MSKSMTLKQYVVSFADRADAYSVPAERIESEVSRWQTAQIARMGRIAAKLSADVSEFDYAPVDFADADYILKGMSGILRNAVSRKAAVVKAVERIDAQKAEEAISLATVGQMVLDGKLGKVAQKRAMAIVA